jgi:hypothetical protein
MRISFGLFLISVLPVLAADNPLSGTWKIDADFEGSPRTIVCTLRQESGKLAGSCKTDEGDREVTGEVSGQKVTWKHKAEYNGEPLMLTYAGTVESPSQIKGTIDVQPMAITGTFTAAKDQ